MYWLLPTALAVLSSYAYFYLHHPILHPTPAIEKDGFWADGEIYQDDDSINTFKIDIDMKKIDEFKRRVAATLYPYPSSFPSGVDGKTVKHLLSHVKDYDWKQHQHFLNTFKHYKTEIEGLQMHFIRSSLPPTDVSHRVVPILLVHPTGPGSAWHFFKLLPILSNPGRFGFDFGVRRKIVFDVIAPSLPGFLFSDAPQKHGMVPSEVARILSKLAARCGFSSYLVHGSGDGAAEIASHIALIDHHNVKALHLSDPHLPPMSTLQYALRALIDTQSTAVFQENTLLDVEGETMVTAVSDSPAALASWLWERWTWLSTRDGKQPHQMFTVDELITEVVLYWLSSSASSSIRLRRNAESSDLHKEMGIASVPHPVSILRSPESPYTPSDVMLGMRYLNITRTNTLDKGGVLQALQNSHALAADIFGFAEWLTANEK